MWLFFLLASGITRLRILFTFSSTPPTKHTIECNNFRGGWRKATFNRVYVQSKIFEPIPTSMFATQGPVLNSGQLTCSSPLYSAANVVSEPNIEKERDNCQASQEYYHDHWFKYWNRKQFPYAL